MKSPTLDLPIMTERLTLRWYRPTDLDALMALDSIGEVTRFIPWGRRSLEEGRVWLQQKIEGRHLEADGDHLEIAVQRNNDGTYIGEVLIIRVSGQHRQGEIGYVFHPAFQGKGYATEAATALLDASFATFGFHRIRARLDARNLPSAALAERLGMGREAHLVQNEFENDEWTDELRYAILAKDWHQRRADSRPPSSPSGRSPAVNR